MLKIDSEVIAGGVAHLRAADRRLGTIIDRVGPCRLRPRGPVYQSLFRAVLYQQLAGNAAAAIMRRVCEPYGGRIPLPEEFIAAADADLRAAGLSRQKTAYLRDLASAFAERRLSGPRISKLSDDDVVSAVTTVHGVGEWTAHMLLMFSLGRPDVLPVGDYGVRKAVQQIYRLRELPKKDKMEKIAAPWRPYRTIASWYLWRSLDPQD